MSKLSTLVVSLTLFGAMSASAGEVCANRTISVEVCVGDKFCVSTVGNTVYAAPPAGCPSDYTTVAIPNIRSACMTSEDFLPANCPSCCVQVGTKPVELSRSQDSSCCTVTMERRCKEQDKKGDGTGGATGTSGDAAPEVDGG